MTMVRFECGREDRIGEVQGPFEFVQLTNGELRAGPDGEVTLGWLNTSGDWLTPDQQVWSDVVIW